MKQLDRSVVTQVHPDEPCYGLAEMDLHGERFQVVYVSRNDRVLPYLRRLDSPLDLPALRIPSPFGENTVGQLWDEADKWRENGDFLQRIKERKGESTLIRDVLEYALERQKIIKNQTQFGPAKKDKFVQRTGFHTERNPHGN